MICQYRLPDGGRPCSRVLAAGRLPVFTVLPITHKRCIECILIAGHCVLGTKKMAAWIDIQDCFDAKFILGAVNWRKHVGQMLQDLDIEDKFLIRRDEAPFQPACSMVDHIAMTHHATPERHLSLIGALRIYHIRGIASADGVAYLESKRLIPSS